jgi:uncharacterized RDD family membrane protein YckC
MTEMAHFANMKAEQSHKIWVEMNDGAFMIAMSIGAWTLIFNLAINFSGRNSTEGILALISIFVYSMAWYLQLEGTITPEVAAILIVVCSFMQSWMYLVQLVQGTI